MFQAETDRYIFFSILGKGGHIAAYRVVERVCAPVKENRHGSCRGHALGDRGHIKDGIDFHRQTFRLNLPVSERFQIGESVFTADRDDNA